MTPVRPKEEDEGIGALDGMEGDSGQEDEGSEGEKEQEHEGEGTGQEGEEVKVRRAPNQPSEKELEDHMVTHVPFRPWCPFCVAGKVKLTRTGRDGTGI